MTDSEWLENLKEGDRVSVLGTCGREWIVTIEKITATQIVAGGTRYNRKDGSSRGSDHWERMTLAPLTKERMEKAWREQAVRKLRNLEWKALPTETLRLILGMAEASNEVTNQEK